jgi:hypothetical protein
MAAVLTESFLLFLEKMPHMVHGPLSRYFVRKMQGQVVSRNAMLSVDLGHEARPMLNFQCLFDNKTPLTLTAKQVIATFYMASSIIDTVIWVRPQLSIPSREVLELPATKVEDLKPKGEARLNFWVPLPPDCLKSEYMRGWNVKGIAVFDSKIGAFQVPIGGNFRIEDGDISQARNKYHVT